MTNQEILDKVANHLLIQNEKAWDEESLVCRYLDPEGNKCAVGCLIPEEQYSSKLEGLIASDDEIKNLPCMQGLDIDFLRDLQLIHDSYEPDLWRSLLVDLANKFELKVNF